MYKMRWLCCDFKRESFVVVIEVVCSAFLCRAFLCLSTRTVCILFGVVRRKNFSLFRMLYGFTLPPCHPPFTMDKFRDTLSLLYTPFSQQRLRICHNGWFFKVNMLSEQRFSGIFHNRFELLGFRFNVWKTKKVRIEGKRWGIQDWNRVVKSNWFLTFDCCLVDSKSLIVCAEEFNERIRVESKVSKYTIPLLRDGRTKLSDMATSHKKEGNKSTPKKGQPN